MLTSNECCESLSSSEVSHEKTISDLEGFSTISNLVPGLGRRHGSSDANLSSGSMPTLISIEESSVTLTPRESNYDSGIPAFLRHHTALGEQARPTTPMREFFFRVFGCGRREE
jgi:hypothetical protein